eukprot:6032668-Amphidinium_carterae.1
MCTEAILLCFRVLKWTAKAHNAIQLAKISYSSNHAQHAIQCLEALHFFSIDVSSVSNIECKLPSPQVFRTCQK